ncbi:DUF4446 family protein [Candidatus Daviesbacteria bacterium]|nr:DUF4446 family protein [Candidatus Daviesbacteria bacterium]
MYSDWVGPAIAGFLAVWLGVLSFLIWKQGNFLQSLFPKDGKRDIRRKFEEVLEALEEFKEESKKTKADLDELREEGLLHISRFWLLRYNPYEDTGGDQSFTVALLDTRGSGFVLTSLHARSQTRVFAKPITDGKSSKYRLSKEEEEVVKKAMKK